MVVGADSEQIVANQNGVDTKEQVLNFNIYRKLRRILR
jgi:hypothetical protein